MASALDITKEIAKLAGVVIPLITAMRSGRDAQGGQEAALTPDQQRVLNDLLQLQIGRIQTQEPLFRAVTNAALMQLPLSARGILLQPGGPFPQTAPLPLPGFTDVPAGTGQRPLGPGAAGIGTPTPTPGRPTGEGLAVPRGTAPGSLALTAEQIRELRRAGLDPRDYERDPSKNDPTIRGVRKKTGKGGGFFSKLGKIASIVGPIAAAFIPGIGPLAAAGIGAASGAANVALQSGGQSAGQILAGAGLGAAGGITPTRGATPNIPGVTPLPPPRFPR